jgi:two-component sensor histidine kinase/DNA-binding response OmpR family regulator
VAKDQAVNVLLVDDQPGKLLSYQVMLEELGENLVPVTSAKEALAYLLKADVAVILVDVCMPELDGFELAKMIREHPRFQKTAIIFISAIHMSETDFLRGYEAGAVDYLSVPVVPELLRAKVRVFAELFRKTRQLHQLNQQLENRVDERTEALNASTEQLRTSEQGRSLALAAGQMGSWDCDFASESWFWDEGQSRILGLDHQDFVPSMDKLEKCLHPDDLAAFREAIAGLSWQHSTFELEIRIVRPNAEARWCRVVCAAVLDSEGEVVRLSGVTTDITERKDAENKQALLAREVDHRAKNALAVVQAIVRLARRENIDEFIEAVEGRINALAQTHELLSRSRWKGADVLRLVLDEMAPYQGGGQRVTAIGPNVTVAPADAQSLAIALHELATNAAKYGALSRESGRVDISWSFFEETLVLSWKESGGPEVQAPMVKGFGTKIIIASFSDRRRSKVDFDWRPEGLCCTVKLNLGASETSSSHEASAAPAPAAGPRSLLLVEDEPLVGIFMENILSELGFSVAEVCRTLDDALAAARRATFHGAILDMNLNGVSVYPLADLLASQGVPFVFVTGYSGDTVETRFAAVPLVQKPIEESALARALNAHLLPAETKGRRASGPERRRSA